jgi:tetratricopeptide (TPR) repeat protein
MSAENPAEYHFKQALHYHEAEDFDRALQECKLAIKHDPTLAEAHNLRGLILEDIEQPLGALSAFKEALQVDPDFTEAQENLDKLRARLATTSELVTIATFSHPLQAHIARSRLEVEGIWAFVADESTVTANWFFSNYLGGIRLQVRSEDAQKASEILEGEPEPIEWEQEDDVDDIEEMEEEDEPQKSPRCGSEDIRYEKYATKSFFLSLLLLGFPLPFLKQEWVCHNCGLRWKE